MTDQPESSGIGYLPYVTAAVSVRANWTHVDQTLDIVIDFAEAPTAELLAETIAALRAGQESDAGLLVEVNTVSEPKNPEICPARLDYRNPTGHVHDCALPLYHLSAEQDGREHRCSCGGLFDADTEPSVTAAPNGSGIVNWRR